MNLFEAKLKMANLIVKAFNVENNEETKRNEAFYNELNSLRTDIKNFGEELASYPAIHQHLECWFVIIHGNGSLSEDEIARLIKGADVAEVAGSMAMLADKLKHDLDSAGWHISVSNSDANGWRMGISCNDEEALKLCSFLHEKYTTEIVAKVVKVQKQFNGYRFKELRTGPEAQAFVQKSAN